MSFMNNAEKKACLILEDGTKFEGFSFGADFEIEGEVVFTTVMAGFQESLTNSVHAGKIVIYTFPVVGSTGVNEEDSLSDENAAACIVREYCDTPSNFRSQDTLGEFMKKRGIVGLCGIDTRALTRIVRDKDNIKGKIIIGESICR